MPRLVISISSIISMARILGAPDKVPAGKVARSTFILLILSSNSPSTELTMCCTWEYFSITIESVTLTVPVLAIRPTSLRARSISITCSAISLGSASSSVAKRASSSGLSPRERVPAKGRMVTIFCDPRSSCRTKISGDEPTTCTSPKS